MGQHEGLKLGLLAAAAVIASSVIAYAAATRSGNIAADGARKAVSVQLAGETEKSRAEFLRTQRQSTYGTFLADEQKISQALDRWDAALVDGRPYAEVEKIGLAIGPAMEKLLLDLANVEIIASTSSADAAGKVAIDDYGYQRLLYLDTAALNGKESGVSVEADKNQKDATQRNATDIKSFVTAARKDLGA